MLSRYLIATVGLCLAVQAAAATRDLPAEVDWRSKGAVTPVKNQGQCDSSWAFAATGAIEGLTQVKTKKLLNLSEQQLTDCGRLYHEQGCNGGSANDAFKYVIANKGIAAESAYPYTAHQASCRTHPLVAEITGFADVPKGADVEKNVEALKEAVARQPVAAYVDARNWENYKGGIFSNCGEDLDHYVLIVGYGKDYWLVKNSWGTDWGEKGYIKLAMGNTCGITEMASHPTG